MVYEQTPWYKLNIPEPEDFMNDPVPQIDNTWTKMNGAANPTIIVGDGSGNVVLPTTGYKIGDRVYAEDPGFNSVNSSFICVTADEPPWGNWWIPVHDQSSPWVNVPAAAFTAWGSALEPEPTDPLQICVTNRSQLRMRGQVRMVANTQIPNGTNEILFVLPSGLRPVAGGVFVGTLDPTFFNGSGGTYDQYRAVKVAIGLDGTSFILANGGTNSGTISRRAHMNQVKFWLGDGNVDYTNP